MIKQISYSLALDVDRSLRLDLNDGQFESLALFIDGYQDGQEITKELLRTDSKSVHNIIDNYKNKVS